MIDKEAPAPKASEIRREAEQQLEAARSRGPHISAWARDWRRIREQNHFAAMIREAFQG